MFKRHLYYYLLKPYLPRQLRLAFRRLLVAWKRPRYEKVWPINEVAGQQPEHWSGWPNGKRFGLVLTHDVEGTEGLERCRHLADLEIKLGFRSCFNFIPEGCYSVPEDLRSWLTHTGFEVGVHDLKHDGKLYINRGVFLRHAGRINHYLKTWKAVGFRSGFMHHHPDWLHDLDIEYDASTFDTDPFEPQPDGVDTIFPFWRSASSAEPVRRRLGYVALPYTLPQDSTLFILLRENSADIWRRKLDWIAERGGMALVNVHPDYLGIRTGTDENGTALTAETHYVEFLQYLNTRYKGDYWHALPRDVSTMVRKQHISDLPRTTTDKVTCN